MINVVIGLGENKEVLLAIEEASKNENLNVKIAKNNEELLKAVKNKDIHAVIRGSLKSSIIKDLNKFNFEKQEQMSLNSISAYFKSINRVSYIKKDKKEFLLAPVGIDEGETIEEKVEIAIQCFEFIKKCGKVPKIAILAGGRKEDFGRNQKIDKTLKDSEKLTNILNKKIEKILFEKSSNSYSEESKNFNNQYSVKNYYILIEKAVADGNNIIIAPDGISGNLIFRTLVLLNSYPSYGAVALGLNKIFIDTSRDQSKDGYLRALKLAYKLAYKTDEN